MGRLSDHLHSFLDLENYYSAVLADFENKWQAVDVVGPDGVKKRFAPGTKAAFAVERFNCQLRDPALPVVCIVAYKDGEDPIEFGPDVELVSYDESWTLKTLREGTGGIFNPLCFVRMYSSPFTGIPVIPLCSACTLACIS